MSESRIRETDPESPATEGVMLGDRPLRPFYTVRDLAQLFQLREPTIRRMIGEQRIAIVKIGGSVRVPGEEVSRLILDGFRPAVLDNV